ncbi:MAG: DUF2059 domain-containing protein [Aquabacterium sp.]|nr:DUF2059 domain-containing protein [Aquabacterium sp.]
MSFVRSYPRLNQLTAALCLSACALAPAWGQATDAQAKRIERVLAVWHPDDVVVVMVQRPAASAMQQARIALQGRVSAEKRDATLKDIAVDIQKYVDEATPIARDTARKQMANTVVPLLQQQFTEDELRQLVALLESPLKKKFEQLIPQMERALGEKVAAESHAQIDPKMQAMTQAVGMKLRAATVAP